eukprot:TRINITY_DN26136_c0_g1_i2.p1 TRINITY_DN26136_c0_g1~~TRINITY_DN26136_c0_g1_i2.p1  ORF type:complete len:383 (+),score=48.17 TRINITY_DN26136_c0_g1_i2:106-1254(+)
MVRADGGSDVGEPAIVPQKIPSRSLETRCMNDEPVYVKGFKAAPGLSPREAPSLTATHLWRTSPALQPSDCLLSENARLAMENEMLRLENLQLSWGAAPGADGMTASYWCGPMDPSPLSVAAMHHSYPSWCPSAVSAWEWSATLSQIPGASRARTESDIPRHVAGCFVGASDSIGRRSQSVDLTSSAPASTATTTTVAPEHRTTVMLRNVPTTFSRDILLELLRNKGFGGLFDFVYLPMDFKTHKSLGYAFVNLLKPDQAVTCWDAFEGYRWEADGDATCTVSWSCPYQGYAAHVERYRNSPIMHEDMPDDYKPAVFEEEQRLPFPPPTKKLKAPRVRPLGEAGAAAGLGSSNIATSAYGAVASGCEKQQTPRSPQLVSVLE